MEQFNSPQREDHTTLTGIDLIVMRLIIHHQSSLEYNRANAPPPFFLTSC